MSVVAPISSDDEGCLGVVVMLILSSLLFFIQDWLIINEQLQWES